MADHEAPPVSPTPAGKRVSGTGQGQFIQLEGFNKETRDILLKFDDNKDGRIDAGEIQAVVSTLVAEKFKSKAFRIGLIILGVFTVILLGAMFGLTWAVVAALKDTKVSGSVLVTNDGSGDAVMTANMDMTVKSGLLVSRNSSGVVTTSPLKTNTTLTVKTPFQNLVKLQSLVFTRPDGAQFSFGIMGVARIPDSTATDGAIVRVQTASGILTLRDGGWSASNTTGPLLDQLFPAAGGRRSLLQGTGTIVICDGDCEEVECGEGTGYDCYSPPPESTASSPPPPASNTNTGANGYTSRCSNPSSSYVWSCLDGVTACFGDSPSLTQVNKIFAQARCSSCSSNWDSQSSDGAFNYKVSEGLRSTYCAVTDSSKMTDSTSLRFCCD